MGKVKRIRIPIVKKCISLFNTKINPSSLLLLVLERCRPTEEGEEFVVLLVLVLKLVEFIADDASERLANLPAGLDDVLARAHQMVYCVIYVFLDVVLALVNCVLDATDDTAKTGLE